MPPTSRVSRRIVPPVAATLLALAAIIVPVSSAQASPAETARATDSAQSCVINVDTDATACFDSTMTPVEEIEAATGAPVVAVPTDPSASASTNRLHSLSIASPAAADTNYLLAVGYDSINFGGSNVSYYTTTSSTCAASTYGFPDLGDWNDRIESIDSYNGCLTVLYQDANFTGTTLGPTSSSADIGSLRNQVSSLVME